MSSPNHPRAALARQALPYFCCEVSHLSLWLKKKKNNWWLGFHERFRFLMLAISRPRRSPDVPDFESSAGFCEPHLPRPRLASRVCPLSMSRGAPCFVYHSALALLKFLMIFQQGTPDLKTQEAPPTLGPQTMQPGRLFTQAA